jgi:hypothetical protein
MERSGGKRWLPTATTVGLKTAGERLLANDDDRR